MRQNTMMNMLTAVTGAGALVAVGFGLGVLMDDHLTWANEAVAWTGVAVAVAALLGHSLLTDRSMLSKVTSRRILVAAIAAFLALAGALVVVWQTGYSGSVPPGA